MFKLIKYSLFFGVIAIFCGCSSSKVEQKKEEPQANIEVVFPNRADIIKTTKGANSLDLETPLRCYVNWETQEMISTIPYNVSAFSLIRNGRNDAMPKYEVNGFSFETMPAKKH